jgi:ethanolamine ammonia-lyase small subunit
MTIHDTWDELRAFTDARIALGRAGAALPTAEVLSFAMAHAMARDAVLTPIDWQPVEAALHGLGFSAIRLSSAATDRAEYLRRPDLGRRLSDASRAQLLAAASTVDSMPDLAIVVGDGLSSLAVAANVGALLAALQPHLTKAALRLAPVVLAGQARVALGDDVGEVLGARAVLVLIGERPGLSSPDSLGAYLTWRPRVGLKDADRNCVSNIRPRGLSYEEAAFKIAWLLGAAFKRGLTGVNLKDESTFAIAHDGGKPQITDGSVEPRG